MRKNKPLPGKAVKACMRFLLVSIALLHSSLSAVSQWTERLTFGSAFCVAAPFSENAYNYSMMAGTHHRADYRLHRWFSVGVGMGIHRSWPAERDRIYLRRWDYALQLTLQDSGSFPLGATVGLCQSHYWARYPAFEVNGTTVPVYRDRFRYPSWVVHLLYRWHPRWTLSAGAVLEPRETTTQRTTQNRLFVLGVYYTWP